jgi:single-strand DNA-binding protein
MNNVVNLIGRLGDNPVCRTLNDGTRVANLSIATDDGYKDSRGEWVKRTSWHRITVWGEKRVDYIEQHYGKGDLVQFSGRLSYSQSERNGTKYHNAELVGSTSLLTQFKREATTEKGEAEPTSQPRQPEPPHGLDDEVPF